MPPARRGTSSSGSSASSSSASSGASKPASKRTSTRASSGRGASKSTSARSASKTSSRGTKSTASTKRSTAAKSTARKRAGSAAKPKAGPTKIAKDASTEAQERFDAAAKRLRKLNDRIIEASRDAGESTLDSYEKALKAIATSIEKGPGSSDIEWVANLASAQAKFIRDVSKSIATRGRDLLK